MVEQDRPSVGVTFIYISHSSSVYRNSMLLPGKHRFQPFRFGLQFTSHVNLPPFRNRITSIYLLLPIFNSVHLDFCRHPFAYMLRHFLTGILLYEVTSTLHRDGRGRILEDVSQPFHPFFSIRVTVTSQ